MGSCGQLSPPVPEAPHLQPQCGGGPAGSSPILCPRPLIHSLSGVKTSSRSANG